MAEKTEEPTPKKLQDARKQGNIALSRDVGAAATFVVGTTIAMLMATRIGAAFDSLYRLVIATIPRLPGDRLVEVYAAPTREAAVAIVTGAGPIWAAIVLIGLVASAAQAGLNVTFEPMKPSLKKINPIEGVKRLFSLKGILDFVKTLIKLAIVLILGYLALSGSMEDVVRLHFGGVDALYGLGIGVARRFINQVGLAFVAVAAADYMITRMQWKKGLRMSKDEIKQEYKESEGDPMIKGQRKQIAQQLLMSEIKAEVPKADCVVTNPTHIAVALRYDKEKGTAPKVTAKGGGDIAKIITDIAKKHEVPVVRDVPLARSLFVVEMGHHVPKELFEAVAEVLMFAWRLKEESQRVPGGL